MNLYERARKQSLRKRIAAKCSHSAPCLRSGTGVDGFPRRPGDTAKIGKDENAADVRMPLRHPLLAFTPSSIDHRMACRRGEDQDPGTSRLQAPKWTLFPLFGRVGKYLLSCCTSFILYTSLRSILLVVFHSACCPPVTAHLTCCYCSLHLLQDERREILAPNHPKAPFGNSQRFILPPLKLL